MACTCRGSDPGVIFRAGPGISISGVGTKASPLIVGSDLADSLVLTVRDSATVNMTVTGGGTEDDPYVVSADTASAVTLAGLGDVISNAPDAGAVPTWVPASATVPGHWEFIIPTTVDVPNLPTTWAANKLSGVIPDANLPARLGSIAQLLATGVDLNTALADGWYRGTGLANAPTSDWYYVQVIASSSTNVVQVAYHMADRVQWVRRLVNGTWLAWTQGITRADLDGGLIDSLYPKRSGTNNINEPQLPFASASGSFNMACSTADGSGYSGIYSVAFPAGRFTEAPAVVAQPIIGSTTDQHWGIKPGTLTKDGFTLYYFRGSADPSVTFMWIARDSRNSTVNG